MLLPSFVSLKIQKMVKTLKIEELALTALGIYFLTTLNLPIAWWLWPILFLSPDISMLGYTVNTKVGAFCYNLFHHKGLAITIIALGIFLKSDYWLLVGGLLFAHSSFDRMLGYGLKFNDNFKHTHLGNMK